MNSQLQVVEGALPSFSSSLAAGALKAAFGDGVAAVGAEVVVEAH